jgi:hypothetical protein
VGLLTPWKFARVKKEDFYFPFERQYTRAPLAPGKKSKGKIHSLKEKQLCKTIM